jgi:P4 family phage/plasmid primase-like protien
MTTTAEPETAGGAGHTMVLSDVHLAELAASCITDQVIAERGYRTLEDTDDNRALLKELKIPGWAWEDATAWPGLLLPIYRATGEVISHQFKPAVPQMGPGDKPMKYASPGGVSAPVDVPPLVREFIADPAQPLWVTEGVKKVDCLVSQKKVAVGLTGVWNWRKKTGTLGDWEDIPLAGRTVVICFDADTAQKRSVMLAMRRFGKWLESKKVAAVRYLIVPAEVNGTAVKGVDDYFHASPDKAQAMRDLGSHALATLPVEGPKDAAFSDSFLTDTLVDDALDGRFVWAPGLGWMGWDGRKWAEVTDAEILEATRLWAIDQFQKVLDEQRQDPNREMGQAMEGWRSLLQASRQRTLVQMARGQLIKSASEFDSHADLLNCPNGIVDLRTGELRSSDPDLFLTQMTKVPYKPEAVHRDWDAALEAVPADVRDWWQARMGQAFTGHATPDDQLVIQLGGGENGKSTVMRPLSEAAGSYYVLVSHRVLMASPDAHPTEMMDFRGKRLAVMEETPEERRLEPQQLKTIVGTDEITARRIRQDPVTFPVTHSLFINTNFQPIVNETDHGTWRRLILMEFPITFRKTPDEVIGELDRLGDPNLRRRCKTERAIWEAALAWAVRGAVAWYGAQEVLPETPERVKRRTRKWRTESDMILSFLDENTVFDPDAMVPGSDLLERFNEWAKAAHQLQNGWTARLFASRFGGHGEIVQKRVENCVRRYAGNGNKATRVWTGLRFKSETDTDSDNPFGSDEGVQSTLDQDRVMLVTPTPVNTAPSRDTRVYRTMCNKRNEQVSDPDLNGSDPGYTSPESAESPEPPNGAPTPEPVVADPFRTGFDTPVYTEEKPPPAPSNDDEATAFLMDGVQALGGDPEEAAAFLMYGLDDVPGIEQPAAADIPAPRHEDPQHDQPTTTTDDDDFWEL